MQTKIIRKSIPFLVVLFGLFLAAAISFGLYAHEQQTPPQVKGAATETKIVISNDSVDQKPQKEKLSTSPSPLATAKPIKKLPVVLQTELSPTQPTSPQSVAHKPPSEPSPTSQTTQPSVAHPTSTPTTTPQIQKLAILVSIDGGSEFPLSIEEGKNQCDVLSQALSKGKISSLNMQYNSAFGSNAVYQINGLGQEGQVWWTYSVNGQNPPLGCSHITVHNNDNVRWTYIGSR